MIVVRDIFQLQFGKAKDGVKALKEFKPMVGKHGYKGDLRFLTDVTGQYYTLVMEMPFESLGAYDAFLDQTTGAEEFGAWYKTFVPYVESGSREIFKVVE